MMVERFEQVYPRYPFAPLVRLSMALGERLAPRREAAEAPEDAAPAGAR